MVDEQIQQPMQQPIVEQPQKSHAWIWWLVGVIVLIGIGILVWILSSGSSDGGSILNHIQGAGSSIPQPPALPE